MDDILALFEVSEERKKSSTTQNPPVVEQQGALTGKEIMDIDIMFKHMPRWESLDIDIIIIIMDNIMDIMPR